MVGDWLARTVQVRVAVPVKVTESVTVAVTVMDCWEAVTAGAVSVADQLLPLRVTVESVPRVVDSDTSREALSSSASFTVPEMVVTDNPSTMAEAVVNVMVGGSPATTVNVMVVVVEPPILSVAVARTR